MVQRTGGKRNVGQELKEGKREEQGEAMGGFAWTSLFYHFISFC